MSKASLELKTYGVRGGSPSYKNNMGKTVTFIDSQYDYISIDAFTGVGDEYKRRQESVINIELNGVSWSGTKEQLSEILKNSQR